MTWFMFTHGMPPSYFTESCDLVHILSYSDDCYFVVTKEVCANFPSLSVNCVILLSRMARVMTNRDPNAEQDVSPVVTLRTTGSTVLFFTISAICALGVGSIVAGDFTFRGLVVAGVPVAVFMIVFALYRFPRVELRHQELALINPLQSIVIPWNLIDGFDTHFGLNVRTPEASYSSWPLAGRGKKMEKDEHGIRRLIENPNPSVDAVLDHFAGLGDDELANPRGLRTVTTTWNVGLIAAVIGAIAWAIVGFTAVPG